MKLRVSNQQGEGMGQELVGTIILSDGRAEFKPKHLLLPLAVGILGIQGCSLMSAA